MIALMFMTLKIVFDRRIHLTYAFMCMLFLNHAVSQYISVCYIFQHRTRQLIFLFLLYMKFLLLLLLFGKLTQQ